ncbi:MAG: hypothetical protein AB7R90_08185 [Reyranellaceae bacterium]
MARPVFLGTLMLLARGGEAAYLPAGRFGRFQKIVRRELATPANEVVLCSLAVRYADPAEVPNSLITERAKVEDSSFFIDS